MKSLGVSMIVKNESECIKSCLESIKDADEIVICDTGSEDDTVEICKKYTDKVYTDYKWNDNFAEARNHSLKKCTTDYVLIIDADEQLIDTIAGIKYVLNSGYMKNPDSTTKYHGLIFNVQTKMEKIESIRVVRNDPEVQWIGAVHNTLALKGSNSEYLKNHCYKTHFEIKSDYSPAHLKDPDRSLRILKKQLEIDPDNVRYMYYISREYINRLGDKEHFNENLDLIINYLEKYDSIAFYKDWENELAEALYCLSQAYIEKSILTGDVSYWYKSIVCAVRAIVILPSFQAPMDFLAVAMTQIPGGRHYMAAAHFWKAMADHANNIGVSFVRNRPQYKLTQNKAVVK